MAITHSDGPRNAANIAVVTLLDAGTAQTVGAILMRVGTGGAISSTLPFAQQPAFGAPTAGSSSALGSPVAQDSVAVGNASPVTDFDAVDRDNYAGGAFVFRGTVTIGGGGGDITLNDTQINANDVVQLTALTYNAMP